MGIGQNPDLRDCSFISYRTGHYKLHYYETPTSLKFVMVSDTKTNNLRVVLHQIYISLYVEYGRSQMCTPQEQSLDLLCSLISSRQKSAVSDRASQRCGRELRNV